jgi:hypothetical protein
LVVSLICQQMTYHVDAWDSKEEEGMERRGFGIVGNAT